ncbi:MAG: Cna B-type domain-containing protein, partial [Firmicutes bacterium]|nr:Cna B-type domain-containing protein [Bacillota bacterium]
MIPSLPTGMAFAADGDYPIPDTSKELIDNEDGTYTLKLSVTGSAKTETENPKVNVVFVMDRSGSMSNDDSYTGQSGYAVAQYGRYGKVNGQYVQLYYRNTYGTGYTAVGNNDNHATVYYRTGTPGNYTYTQYSLGRYNQVNNIRRDQVAIAAATDLADNLLSYNTASSPDTVEMAFVWFNDMASPGNNSQWTTSTTTAENVIRGFSGQNNTGTNWEDALIDAKTLADNKADDADQEGEQMFIIFLTDGNPTRYVDDNGNRQGNGQETTTNIATCYNEAAPRARQLTDAGYEMYNIGVFGNVSRMEDLTAYSNDSTAANHGTATYYPASNAAALEAAFAEILRSITNSLSLSDVKFTDGVTDMTHSTGVNGVPDNFQYTMTVNGEETPWADAPEATVNENKEVIWDLSKDREGNDLIIADGVTVTCSFLVWPDQDAMDLIADLNNKKVSYDSLTDDQKAQITGGPAGPFALKTNTECKLNYSILENRDGDIHEIPQDPITLDPPEPMPLYIDWLSLEKKWDDSLDPDQREEVEGEVVLDFYKDNTIYTLPGYENGITLTEAENWIKEDFLSIATGIMVSEDSPAYDADAYPVVTYDGKDYCILETGHDYHFQEQDINDHYELTAYTYHPMLVDGVLHNLTFEYDDEDNIIGVTEGAEISTVSATNTIKGGVSITKKVVDEDGNEVDTADPFTITMHMQTPEGDAYKYDYRIYYGEKNPHYNDPEPGTENPSEEAMATNLQRHRSGHFIGTATEVTVTLYQGDELRFVNMDDDTRYYVEETVPQGYELDGMTYQIRYGDDDPETEEDESQYHDFTDDQKVTIDGKTYYIMDGNSSAAVEVTNILKKGDLKVAKTVVNGDTNKEFTFTLDLEDSSEEEVEGTFNYVIYNSDDEKVSDGTISSGGTFKLKDGQYIIVEGLPAGTTYTVTETEEDGYTTTVDGTETLEATGTVIVDNPTTDPVEMASSEFTNTYDASGTAVLEAIKAISGADWPEDATITFTLAGQGGTLPTTKTVTLTEPGKATFDAITYGLSDAGQTYNYTITEDGFGDGWTADPGKVITATVVVTDNGDGTLDTAITYSPEDDTITNKYEAEGEVELEAIKAISGADWPEDATITFTLAGTGGTLPETKTVTLTEPGKATFDAITYDESDAGQTYTYTITEDGFGTGWTADPGKVITATVKVTDNGDGTLDTEVTYDPEDDTITNVYSAEGTAVLQATKVVDGAEWPENGSITFTLAGEGGTLPETKAITLTAAGTATFDAITYDESDIGQTYTYTITEDGFGTGWTADPGKVITATVKVTDKGDGELATEITYDPEDATITNIYDAEGEVELEAIKAIEGADWPEDATITFTLAGEGGTLPTTKTVTLEEPGKATFDAITYDESDIGKTYTYTITEDGFGTGWTADPGKVITATVKVIDNGDGTLDTEVTYDPEDDTITNKYDAEGEVELKAIKAIEGAGWPANGSITFTLAGEGGTLPETKTVTLTAPGTAEFDAITYDESDIGETYTYTITEDGFGDGWTADPGKVITATVKVIDNGDGTLDTEVTYDPEDDTITNVYAAEGTAELKAIKAIEGAGWPENGSITFTLAGEGGTLPTTKTVTLTEPGTATFGAITYDESDIGETYTYTITEDGFGTGWTANPGKVITATVKVTDKGDGTLATEITYSPENDTITNKYDAEGEVELEAIKAISGADWPEGKSITFTLAGEGGTLPETKTETLTAPGKATFDAITYDESDIGQTYTYTITEDGFGDGWTADPGKVITATVKVTDNGDGTLDTEVTYDPEDDTITNIYEASGSATLKAKKLLEGRDWMESESFTFTLKDPNGTVLEEKTVTADGEVEFAAISYDESDAGKSYTYTITETGNSSANVTPSGPVEATVTITDNGDGSLATDVTYSPEDATIINTYVPTPVNAQINVNKTIDGFLEGQPDKTFEFTLYEEDGETQVGESIEITTEGGTGSSSFAAIQYTAVGEYNYIVKETVEVVPGYTYSTIEYPVVVTVTDDPENGKLVADVSYGDYTKTTDEDTLLDVINEFKMEDVDVTLTLTKKIDDQSNSAPEGTFNFKLYKDSVSEE